MYRNRTMRDVLALADVERARWGAISAGIARSGVPTCEVADASLKDKLKQIETEIAEARDERVVARREADAARDAYAKLPSLTTKSPEFKAAEQAVSNLGEVEDRLADLQAAQVATLRMLGKDVPGANGGASGHHGGAGWGSRELIGAHLEQLAQMATSTMPTGRVELGRVMEPAELAASLGQMVETFGGTPLAADVAGTDNMRRGQFGGIVPQLRRSLRILDLIPTGTMDGNTYEYVQEGGSFATAAETAEGATKPEAAATFTDAEAKAATVAHWLKIRKQTLADQSALQSTIDNRLRYGVLRRLEAEILAGNGTGENLTGILSTSGIGAITYDAAELVADQILAGVTTVFLADAEASAIVMHPLDWKTALKAKAAGDGHYYSNGPFSVTPQQMWGTPLIPSAAIPQGMALVGDFALGAMLLIREGVRVLLSDSDQDDFIRNKVTMLAEMRAALPIFRPAAFATVDLAP